MVGLLFGSFTFGIVSDYYGRLKAMMMAVMIVVVSGGFGAIPGGGAVWFGMMRVITGFGVKGLFMIAFVMIIESVGPKMATILGIAINIPFAIGAMLFVWEAHQFHDWYSLQLVGHLPTLLLLLLWFLVPESPRWLIATGQNDKAIKIINDGARMNHRETPVKLHLISNDLYDKENNKTSEKSVKANNERRATVLDIFKPKIICFRTLNLFFQWFSVTLCYYGKYILCFMLRCGSK